MDILGVSRLEGKEVFVKSERKYKVAKSAIAKKCHLSRGSLVNVIVSRNLA